jgi:adenylate cyclase
VLAQRVEQLAVAGRVCVTSAVREAIPDRLPFAYDDLGEQSAKGFDNPVRVYAVELKPGVNAPELDPPRRNTTRLRRSWIALAAMVLLAVCGALAWLQPWQPEFDPARRDKMAFALPDKPSIAVLPFDSFSNESGDQRLVDGFTENLTSVIARLPNFLVTARNSALRFRW